MKGGLGRLLNGEQRLRLAGHPLATARRAARGLAALAFDHRGLRRRVLRTLMFHAMAPATSVVAVERDGLRFLVETADLGPGRIMFTRGSLETDVLERALTASQLSDEARAQRLFVDVGANVGAATVLALGRHGFGAALAVEPNAANAALLRANLAINGLDERCTTVLAAAGATDGSVEMELSPDNFGDHRVRVTDGLAGEFKEERRQVQRVQLRTLDSILAGEGLRAADVGLLWVDVQGYEAQVLGGAHGLLEEGVPMLIEFWPYGLARAGGREALCELIEGHFGVFIDLHAPPAPDGVPARRPIAELRTFRPRRTADATDLLLLP